MLDQLIVGDARRISPEAPIPVVSFGSETFVPGGAGNVARALVSLGASADLFGVMGDDSGAGQLRATLAQYHLPTNGLIVEPARPTTLKTRITAQRQQIVRLDRETNRPLARATQEALITACCSALRGAAAVIVTDYAKGCVDQRLVDVVLQEAQQFNVPVCIDPKPGHPLAFHGCALLTPNRREAFELAGLPDPGATADPSRDPALLAAIAQIQRTHHAASLLVTLSEQGLLLVEGQQPPHHVPTVARQVYDVTGAGDTVIATFVLARAAGASSAEAAAIANLAAGIVVGKTGTAAATPEELLHWIEHTR
ncbi:PfkB domain protein [Opitutus terrae PB90-1]|uniref:PfkB domain protein n=2 Tax=Opitutus terrae TaxID=107709 RepID=B1ZZR0_OPITP|nr:PfkB domain protein [Opitutus terrae PB90-1]